jgi:hypothetical protein
VHLLRGKDLEEFSRGRRLFPKSHRARRQLRTCVCVCSILAYPQPCPRMV